MSRVRTAADQQESPAIGGLLRLVWQAHLDRLYDLVIEDGFTDVTRAQFALMRWPSMDGMRPSEVAEFVGLTKQTVNGLLGELERQGYAQRRPDPRDGRARVIRLTAKGWRLYRTTYAISKSLEAEWARRIGERRFRALRQTLEDMVAKGLSTAVEP